MVRVKLPMQMIGQIAVMALLTSPSFAGPQFVDGAALSGYDAIAYQDEGAAVRGETTITTEWNGATWRFATPAHLAQFRADPARYAPAYDGHCAYAASEGRKSGGMPELWQVKGGRLYLLCSKSAVEKWTSEFDTRLARANANWLTLEPLPAARPNPPPPATPNPAPPATP
jgi:YHS domain-containing protein